MKTSRQLYDPNAAGSGSKTKSNDLVTQIQGPICYDGTGHVELVHTLALDRVLEL